MKSNAPFLHTFCDLIETCDKVNGMSMATGRLKKKFAGGGVVRAPPNPKGGGGVRKGAPGTELL